MHYWTIQNNPMSTKEKNFSSPPTKFACVIKILVILDEMQPLLVLFAALLWLQASLTKAENIRFESVVERVSVPKSPSQVLESEGLTTFLKAVNQTGLGPLFDGIVSYHLTL